MRYQFTCYRFQNVEFIYLSKGVMRYPRTLVKKNKHVVPMDLQVKYKNEN